MAFEPRIYGEFNVPAESYNLLPWRKRKSPWTPPVVAELTSGTLCALFADNAVRIAAIDPIWTPEGITYCTTYQLRQMPDDQEGQEDA